MYFIRIMLLWYMLVLSARCSSFSEIPLVRAEQSSTLSNGGKTYFAARAIDGDLGTGSSTTEENPAWLRVYFKSSYTVERLVVELGIGKDAACVITVSVYDGEIETVCGAYTGKKPNG